LPLLSLHRRRQSTATTASGSSSSSSSDSKGELRERSNENLELLGGGSSELGGGLDTLKLVELALELVDGGGDALAGAGELGRTGLDEVELGVERSEVGGGLLHALLKSALDLEVLDLALLDVKLADLLAESLDVGHNALELGTVELDDLLDLTDPGLLVLDLLGLGDDVLAERLQGSVELLVLVQGSVGRGADGRDLHGGTDGDISELRLDERGSLGHGENREGRKESEHERKLHHTLVLCVGLG